MRIARLIPPAGPQYAVGDVRAVVADSLARTGLDEPAAAA